MSFYVFIATYGTEKISTDVDWLEYDYWPARDHRLVNRAIKCM